jgi:hypothetical protein
LGGLGVGAGGWNGDGDNFYECRVSVEGAEASGELGVQAGPDLGFVGLEIWDEVVPGWGRGEGFEDEGCYCRQVCFEEISEVGVWRVGIGKWLLLAVVG